ncbi:hypothetical protein QR98_0077570 [Sarcoptes scabiei]|uniref:Uncharacterized protein n=1 Tax=Sarcoptes scabiei TaxID=52283 RepID=A0A132AE15_SARSC|nr:hypothetical protein QR98_0077570 [Sarcoptes scabiei]
MTPQKQRRSSITSLVRNGPPPKAPPKTNRARRKNYLLNLQKPQKIEELFLSVDFLQHHFFRFFQSIEFCNLAQN